MELHVLAVGDVVGDEGVECLSRRLRALKREQDIHFTVVNGENSSGVGILPRQAEARSLTPGPTSSPSGTTPGTGSRSPATWTTIPISSARPTTRSAVPGRGWGVFDGPRRPAHRRDEPHRPV